MLLVDQSGSTRFGEPVTKAALAVEVAAVLALAAAYHNDRVGALLFADQVERVIPPRKGRRHALRVIRDLVAFQPAGRRTNLAASLSYASRLLRHRSIVVVLSDFIAEGWERPLRRLAARHEVVAITVDDPREHELPDVRLDRDAGRRVGPPGAGGYRQPRGADPGLAPGRAPPGGAEPHAGRGRAPTTCALETGRGLRHPAAARVRPAGAADPPRMIVVLTPALAAGAATVGDTIWVTRERRRPAGRTAPRRRLGAGRSRRAARARRASSSRGGLGRDRLSGRRSGVTGTPHAAAPRAAPARRRWHGRLARRPRR